MAIIRPFKAIRPDSNLAHLVAALPYDVMNSEEARQMVEGNPYSFLRVDRAEIELDRNINLYDKKVYEKARQKLNEMIDNNILIKDSKPYFYIYSLKMEGRTQTGLVVCTSIDEYIDNTIKKHEFTREDKEQDRINHVDYCNANTGPIFLTYKHQEKIDYIIENWTLNHNTCYDFIADDGVEHKAWIIADEEVINDLIEGFKGINSLYIADGHHRNASAVKVGLKRRKENPHFTGDEEFNYYLSVLFPNNQLKILDYNRVVKDLNGLSTSDFIKKLENSFNIEKMDIMYKPEKNHTYGMYLEGNWYKLTAKDDIIPNDTVGVLDVSILQEQVLTNILGIKDIRTDDRINFVGGIRGLSELEKLVDSGLWKVAFAMYPTSVDELMNIADEGKIMPPKSTWFEPKLRSGLFIHSLE